MGELLCFREKTKMGKQGLYAWPHAASVRVGRYCGPGQHDRRAGERGSYISSGNDGGHCAGILYRSGDGAAFPCEVLGLQQSETESPRIYLCDVVSVLGILFRPARKGGACAGRDGCAQDPSDRVRGRGACAVSGSGGGSDAVVQRGDGSETDTVAA